MRSRTDPTRRASRRAWTTRVVAGSLVACCLVWSLWPLKSRESIVPPIVVDPVDPSRSDPDSGFNETAFLAALWVEPATPVPDTANAPPPPPRVRLALIGIVEKIDPLTNERVRYAALYDPDQDRLHMVRDGERLGAQLVESVEESGVVLSVDGRRTRLDLEGGQS